MDFFFGHFLHFVFGFGAGARGGRFIAGLGFLRVCKKRERVGLCGRLGVVDIFASQSFFPFSFFGHILG